MRISRTILTSIIVGKKFFFLRSNGPKSSWQNNLTRSHKTEFFTPPKITLFGFFSKLIFFKKKFEIVEEKTIEMFLCSNENCYLSSWGMIFSENLPQVSEVMRILISIFPKLLPSPFLLVHKLIRSDWSWRRTRDSLVAEDCSRQTSYWGWFSSKRSTKPRNSNRIRWYSDERSSEREREARFYRVSWSMISGFPLRIRGTRRTIISQSNCTTQRPPKCNLIEHAASKTFHPMSFRDRHKEILWNCFPSNTTKDKKSTKIIIDFQNVNVL